MKRCSIWLLVLLVFVALTSTAAAAVPRLINYQGALTDSRGVAVEGMHTLTFSFYSSTDAGAPALWKEEHRNIDVNDGLFHVILGSVNPIPDKTFASGQLWIGISVDNDPEMDPRMQMTAVPWAVRAAVADALASDSGSGPAHMMATSPPARELMSEPESEMLRADFLEICNLYYELGSLTGSEALVMLSIEARGEFEDLSWEDLSIFGESTEPVGRLRSALTDFNALVISNRAGREDAGSPMTPGFPDANYSGLCGSDRSNTEVLFAARLVLEIAQGVWAGLSRGCDETIAGFNLSLACIPVDIILFAAQVVFDEIENCDNDIDSAEVEGTYERSAHLHGDIELVQTTSDSIADMVFILNEKVDVLFDMMEALRETNCEIIRLLHTPQGQRTSDVLPCADQPGYPYDWAEE